MLRAHDEEWYRASFHEPFAVDVPVVLAQVQNYEERLDLITVRQHLFPPPGTSSPHFSVFVQVDGEGIWCPDGQYFAEYYDSLDL